MNNGNWFIDHGYCGPSDTEYAKELHQELKPAKNFLRECNFKPGQHFECEYKLPIKKFERCPNACRNLTNDEISKIENHLNELYR